MVLNPYDPYDKNQQWRISAGRIENRHKLNVVIQVANGDVEPGARLVPALLFRLILFAD